MFPDMLISLRKSRNLTQAELAKKVGVGRSTIGMYEAGKREPDFETLEAFADFFNVNMSTLLGESELKNPIPVAEDKLDRLLIQKLTELRPDEIEKVIVFIQGLVAGRKD